MMRSARKRSVPDVPMSLEGLRNILLFQSFGEKFQCHDGQRICKAIINNGNGTSVVLYCSSVINDMLSHENTEIARHAEIHADGTFKVVPSVPQARQLFVIHVMFQNHSVPVCFALMEKRSKLAYKEVITHFKENVAPTLVPATIITDYEQPLQSAFEEVYGMSATGCFFHYSQAEWKYMRKHNYLVVINTNQDARCVLKMLMVLPLLPAAEIEEGLTDIKYFARARQINLSRLIQYVKRQINQGQKITRSKKCKFIAADAAIKDAQRQFSNREISRIQFLKICSHSVEGTEGRLRHWALYVEGDEDLSSEENGPLVPSSEEDESPSYSPLQSPEPSSNQSIHSPSISPLRLSPFDSPSASRSNSPLPSTSRGQTTRFQLSSDDEDDITNESGVCAVCWQKTASFIFWDCRHVAACEVCVSQYTVSDDESTATRCPGMVRPTLWSSTMVRAADKKCRTKRPPPPLDRGGPPAKSAINKSAGRPKECCRLYRPYQ
ncbi:hypothetical protein Zmor_018278 [Zophobas morio]|uniref:RING-type domain-containing protein n=1 Tax=Zophobas morio TaxID=2755281 RepID=A0AA38IAW5_9CUCU|nr:hypothetical protein Zmor_018278 [Zophobas morio]